MVHNGIFVILTARFDDGFVYSFIKTIKEKLRKCNNIGYWGDSVY